MSGPGLRYHSPPSTPGTRHMELGQIGLKIEDLKGRCGALRGYL